MKSHAAELEQQLLYAEGETLRSLRNQEINLKSTLMKVELECKCLLETIEQKQKCTEMQEAELHEVNLQLQLKEKQINSLKVDLANQDNVSNSFLQDYAVLESSLCRSLEYMKDAENIAFKHRKDLSRKIDYSSSLNKELQSAIANNELTDSTLEESSKDLQDAKQAIRNERDHVTQSSYVVAEEMQILSTELMEEWDRLKAVSSLLTEVASQRHDLSRSFDEKRAISNRLKEQLKSLQKQLSTLEAERTDIRFTLDEQLLQRSVRQRESELSFKQLRNVSLDGQSGFDKRKAFRHRLTEEFPEVSGALRASKNEVSYLQDSIDLLITQIPDLLKGLGRLGETRKDSALALKKEKRASAYARKKLAMCQEKLTEEETHDRALREELEQTRELLQHMEEQSSILSKKLAKEDARAILLHQDILQLKAELVSEHATHEGMKKVCKTGTVRHGLSVKARCKTLSKQKGSMQILQREADTAAVDGS